MNQDDLFVLSQYLTPQHGLSRLIGKLADSNAAVRTPVIKWFINRYGVDMSEALQPDPAAYASFNDFFTRELKPGARTVDPTTDSMISPVDGAISQLGDIEYGRIFQAKGQDFSLVELLGGDVRRAEPFMGGKFATIYLAPKDYHRIHMPCEGTLKEMVYVPGQLFSVNPVTAAKVPRLFARNERVVTIFDTPNGPLAMVLVGAMIVASVETVWAGVVAPRQRKVHVDTYGSGHDKIHLAKGEEMGRFRLGSTVVLVTPPDTVDWQEDIQAESVLRMGQLFGRYQTKD